MSSNLDAVVTALTAEFDLEVVFQDVMPSVFTAPSVVVFPHDDWIQPYTHGGMGGLRLERWNVLAVVSTQDMKSAIDLMRELDLRVDHAVSGTGAAWRGSSGPRRPIGENTAIAMSISEIEFYYDPVQYLPPVTP